jgi:hypothetical protein
MPFPARKRLGESTLPALLIPLIVGDLGRLRKERALFNDILRGRGSKVPITAVVANLNDPKDAGLRKALARVGRALRRES